jgi:hypothetical protein
MNKRGEQTLLRARRRGGIGLVTAVASLTIAFSGTALARSASPAAGPPNAFFAKNHNLCRAASLVALRRAGGQRYEAGMFVNQVCNWERLDLKAGVTLATHPSRVGATLMHDFLGQDGRSGFTAKIVRVPGASKAVLVTLPASAPHQISKDLFAAYSRGVIQVNMTAPGQLADARLIAVMRLVAGT